MSSFEILRSLKKYSGVLQRLIECTQETVHPGLQISTVIKFRSTIREGKRLKTSRHRDVECLVEKLDS